jgi:type VI secretion system protein ImpM
VTFQAGERSPGWYGKLPSLGDFARRRLPDDFVQPWDAWLQEVLQTTRASVGAAWLDAYLTMPIWRFVIVPGAMGVSGWAGVLTPSVDRVGRHFPLTIAVPLPSYTAAAHAAFDGGAWFERVEDTALTALDPTCGPEDLDRTLVDQALIAPAASDMDDGGEPMQRLARIEGFGSVAKGKALRAWAKGAAWTGLWWTRGRVEGDALMLTCAALPTPNEFAWLMDSDPSRTAPLGAGDAAPLDASRPADKNPGERANGSPR